MQVWWTKGINFEDALIAWTQSVLSYKTAPPLFSVSYGGPETDFGGAYIAKLNNDLAMMGTAGISVMFASGDSGAGGGCAGDGAAKENGWRRQRRPQRRNLSRTYRAHQPLGEVKV